MKDRVTVFSLAKDGLTGKRPFEDAMKYDMESGVFAIADGVGLWEGIEYQGRYPKKSGSAKLAKAFCDGFIRHHKKNPTSDILESFKAGNRVAGKVNIGRSKYDAFRKQNGLFAATVAIALLKGRKLEWAHVCDAGIAIIGKGGVLKMKKDGCGDSFPWPKDIAKYESSTRTFFWRTIVRNGIGLTGKPQGYGVVTGEPEVEHFIERGTYTLSPGEAVVLFSDGFAPYLELSSFKKLIVGASSDKEFKAGAEEIIDEKTAVIRRKFKGKKFDWLASVEIVMAEAKKILGKDAGEFEWAKEKSIIVIR